MWIHAARKEKIQVINIPNESSEFLVISSGFFFLIDCIVTTASLSAWCLSKPKNQREEKRGEGESGREKREVIDSDYIMFESHNKL